MDANTAALDTIRRNASGNLPVGVVLAGGRSSRLGYDKVTLRFGGKSLLQRAVAVLGQVTGPVVVCGRDPSPCQVTAPWLPDAIRGVGPAGGVLTALERLGVACLVISCDLPFLDATTLHRLVAAWRRRPAHARLTTYRIVENGYIESLTAVYEPAGASRIRHGLISGENRLSAIFPETVRHHVDYSRNDPAKVRIFCNINTPEELHRARVCAKQETGKPARQVADLAHGRRIPVDAAASAPGELRRSA